MVEFPSVRQDIPVNSSDISVVIPCYNREHCLSDAITSVLNQDSPVGEVIVVDDGSQDGSAQVAASFGGIVRVIRTENRGGSAARNLGIQEARGDWIAFLDSDDTWVETKISEQINALRAFPQAGLIFCDQDLSQNGELIMPSRFALGGVRTEAKAQADSFYLFDETYFITLLTQSRIFTSSVLARRDLAGLHFPDGFVACQDWPVWLRLARETPFVAVDSVLVHMTKGQDNVTNNTAALFKYSLDVLSRFSNDEALDNETRCACRDAYKNRCRGALYYGIWLGDKDLARRALTEVERDISPMRRWFYRTLLCSPSSVLRMLGHLRLQTS